VRAYAVGRLPAIHAVTSRIFDEVDRRLPDLRPKSVLDFGSGPGTALWSALDVWGDSIQSVQAVEPNRHMTAMAQRLLRDETRIQWSDRLPTVSSASSDIVVASFVLSELPNTKTQAQLVKRLWARTKGCLVLVEPGTPHGFEIIKSMRSILLSSSNARQRHRSVSAAIDSFEEGDEESEDGQSQEGAYVVAPCSHEQHCPMTKMPGLWCRFSQRLERGRVQCQLKRAKVPHEDEKFSYLVLARGPRPAWDDAAHEQDLRIEDAAASWPRIIKEPVKRSGHVQLELCCPSGEIRQHVVKRSHGELGGYRQARKAVQGDLWQYPYVEEPREEERYD